MGEKKYEYWISEEGIFLLEGWGKRGLNKADIAHNMGIHPSTLSEWLKVHPEIDKAIKSGKAVTDILVENSLVKSALGFIYTEVTKELVPVKKPKLDKDGNEIEGLFEEELEMKVVKEVDKVQPPNATSMIFYLKNKLPEHYKDRKEQHITGGLDNSNDPLKKLTTEEIRDAIQEMKAKREKGDSDDKPD